MPGNSVHRYEHKKGQGEEEDVEEEDVEEEEEDEEEEGEKEGYQFQRNATIYFKSWLNFLISILHLTPVPS